MRSRRAKPRRHPLARRRRWRVFAANRRDGNPQIDEPARCGEAECGHESRRRKAARSATGRAEGKFVGQESAAAHAGSTQRLISRHAALQQPPLAPTCVATTPADAVPAGRVGLATVNFGWRSLKESTVNLRLKSGLHWVGGPLRAAQRCAFLANPLSQRQDSIAARPGQNRAVSRSAPENSTLDGAKSSTSRRRSGKPAWSMPYRATRAAAAKGP